MAANGLTEPKTRVVFLLYFNFFSFPFRPSLQGRILNFLEKYSPESGCRRVSNGYQREAAIESKKPPERWSEARQEKPVIGGKLEGGRATTAWEQKILKQSKAKGVGRA